MIVEMKVPSPGESITEVQISRWLVADGEYVFKDDEICEIDSDKATLTMNAEEDGAVKILVKEGEIVKVKTVVCTIDTNAERPKSAAKAEEKKAEEKVLVTESKEKIREGESKSTSYSNGLPSASARKIMEEKSIPASSVKPTGKGGRITKSDVLKALSGKAEGSITREGTREKRIEKLSMLRKKVGERLVAVKNETAMLTTFNEVDMSAIMEIRKKYKDKFKEVHGVSLGFMSFFTKAVTSSLKLFPAVNAMIDGNEIIYHDYADIGIAVSTPKGLMVPVIRNAETLSFAEIENRIIELAEKARSGSISIDEMKDGTFTITNGGVFGSMLSTPILNPPQSAILGMHNIVERPVAANGKVVIRPIMYVALSYDHRIIDGKESVSFLLSIKEMLENPVKMFTGGKDLSKVLLDL